MVIHFNSLRFYVYILLALTHYTFARSAGDARELLKMFGTKDGDSDFENSLQADNKPSPSSSLTSPDLQEQWADDRGNEIENSRWGNPRHSTYFRFGDHDLVSNEDGDSKYPGEGVDKAMYLALNGGLENMSSRHRFGNTSKSKRYRPRGYIGSRGKRYLPGLESLLLAQYFQDAEKWKRQPHLGFHGSRG